MLKGGRQGRGEEEKRGTVFAEVNGPSDGERQEGRVPLLPWLRPAGLLLRLPAAQSRAVTCGGEVWLGSEQRGHSVVEENEMKQEGWEENHNTTGNESSETMNVCIIRRMIVILADKEQGKGEQDPDKVKNGLEPRSDSSLKQEPDKEILASRPHQRKLLKSQMKTDKNEEETQE